MSGPRVVLLAGAVLVPLAVGINAAAVLHAYGVSPLYVVLTALLHWIGGWLIRDTFARIEAEYSRRRAASILPYIRERY